STLVKVDRLKKICETRCVEINKLWRRRIMGNNIKEFMKEAIKLSRTASIEKKTGGVFGCVIVKDGKIIGRGYNQVIKNNDPTWHAEMEAIREACKALGTPHLDGCDLYTSAESCPMCLAAAYWAHIKKIYYGATVE